MKRVLLIVLLIFLGLLFLFPQASFAIEDPLSSPNNKMGIHILFPEELNEAAGLVNSSGGDWGYVTIPIQAGDRNMEKWQEFMDDANKLHLIPIIRLATAGDYFNTSVWGKPSEEDILDFANFLNSLVWPVKNRYIVVFNEVNRGDEWEGILSPKEYAEILKYAAETFKSLNSDFFIISSGLDNASPNVSGKYMNEYDYMVAMNEAVSGIFSIIDGLGSHSYPNPGFRQMPYILTSQSIYSFNFERNLAYRLSGKNLPVFITETGWSKEAVSENQIAAHFRYAFQYVWADKNIVAVTPFLLQAGTKPFSHFSLIENDGRRNEIFLALAEIPKTKGEPIITGNTILPFDITNEKLPVKNFPKKNQYKNVPAEKVNVISDFFKWLLKLSI